MGGCRPQSDLIFGLEATLVVSVVDVSVGFQVVAGLAEGLAVFPTVLPTGGFGEYVV